MRTGALLALVALLIVGCYPSLAIAPSSLPDATVGQPYTQVITASGGEGVQNMSSRGSLPPGLTFVYDRPSGSGLLAGIPTAPGTYAFEITASGPHYNFGGSEGTRNYTLVVR